MKTIPPKGTRAYAALVVRLRNEQEAKLKPGAKPETQAEAKAGSKELFRKRAADNISRLKI
jgi:hypothetical protein